MIKTKRKNPNDKNDLRNYTIIDENFFNEIFREVGNEEEILKIVDGLNLRHPIYYCWTKFLINDSEA